MIKYFNLAFLTLLLRNKKSGSHLNGLLPKLRRQSLNSELTASDLGSGHAKCLKRIAGFCS